MPTCKKVGSMYELKHVNLMSSAIGLPDTGCDVVASRVDAPDMGIVQNWSRVRNALKIQSLILPGLGCLVEVSVPSTPPSPYCLLSSIHCFHGLMMMKMVTIV